MGNILKNKQKSKQVFIQKITQKIITKMTDENKKQIT